MATSALELTIGTQANDPRYQFASIASILEALDGTLWVADGSAPGLTPKVRLFSPQGTFVREVGNAGAGPGEFRAPQGLALLRDGRVALRDAGTPGRITVYRPDGTLDAIWSLGVEFRWPHGADYPIQVDEDGVIWLPVVGRARPGPDRPRPFFLRVSPNGVVLDSVELPVVPKVDPELTIAGRTRDGGLMVRGVHTPYQPTGIWGWSPTGQFATARTDKYQIKLNGPDRGYQAGELTGGSHRYPQVYERDVDAVPVRPDEKRALERQVHLELTDIDGGDRLRAPEISTKKPLLKGVFFTREGRLIVHVSVPSVRRDDEWTEPPTFDVFDVRGQFLGRLALEEDVVVSEQLIRLHGSRTWAVHQNVNGVQSIRRYLVRWPYPKG